MSRALPRLAALVLALAGIPLFTLAAWWSLRIARADLLESRPTLHDAQEAVRLTPASAAAHKNAAAVFEAVDPLSAANRAELQAALRLSPRDSAAWMALGLDAEIAGDLPRAEQYLLGAARVDHMFKPAWSLANFYARTGQSAKFWPWIRKSADLMERWPGEPFTFDPNPVFALSWSVTTDAETIERLAIPPRPFILDEYVRYLTGSGRIDAALGAAARLYSIAGSTDLPALFYLCDSLIQRGRGANAVTVWNGAVTGRLPLYEHLDPHAGKSLTNGTLSAEPSGTGFDWRIARPPDIYGRYVEGTRTMRFDINGDEPEQCELVSAAVPLLPGRRYRFHYQYRTTEMTGTPGLHWSLSDADRMEQSSAPGFPARDEDGEAAFDFSTPASFSLGWLALRYDRLAGYTRPRGSLWLGPMRLELLP